MLEKFTHEEIEQLKEELKLYDRKNMQKHMVVKEDAKRITAAYRTPETMKLSGIYPESEISKAIFNLCDHVTCNYELNHRFGSKRKYTHKTQVPKEIADTYKKVFKLITDIIIEYKMPFRDPDT